MISRAIFLGLLVLLVAVVGCGRSQTSTQNNKRTNILDIHLQENFFGTEEVIITVDGAEVYRGKPKINIIGVAGGVSVSNLTPHPIVTFSMPGKGIYWSNQVYLSNGAAIGFTWRPTPSNHVDVVQAPYFVYD